MCVKSAHHLVATSRIHATPSLAASRICNDSKLCRNEWVAASRIHANPSGAALRIHNYSKLGKDEQGNGIEDSRDSERIDFKDL